MTDIPYAYERKTITNERGIPIHDAIVILPTLRDQFAMAALTGLVASNDPQVNFQGYAATAWAMADAMLEARK